MEMPTDSTRDLILLDQIEQNPDATQASLAVQIGVAVATVNWHLKRLINKGYVKVRRTGRRKLRYMITPEGITLRARLTLDYIQTSFRLYRETRKRVNELLGEVRQAGFDQVHIVGDGDGLTNDIADVCRLTCLEQSIRIAEDNNNYPTLIIHGFKVALHMEDIQ